MESLKDLKEDSWELNVKVMKYTIPSFIAVIIFLLFAVVFNNVFLMILTLIIMFLGLVILIYFTYKMFKLSAKIYKKRKEER